MDGEEAAKQRGLCKRTGYAIRNLGTLRDCAKRSAKGDRTLFFQISDRLK
ncbi:hypothetical protein ACE1CI_26615 [Aerosakkonemataceae cyanobacterium BLCC-F50]|uniref:Uncharacterized protein n=1 Tax=Floridaenema flaviceps BLCC-F50 TaxID=3153642 RepID=A0ABV4XXN2_9CYAN